MLNWINCILKCNRNIVSMFQTWSINKYMDKVHIFDERWKLFEKCQDHQWFLINIKRTFCFGGGKNSLNAPNKTWGISVECEGSHHSPFCSDEASSSGFSKCLGRSCLRRGIALFCYEIAAGGVRTTATLPTQARMRQMTPSDINNFEPEWLW